MQPFIYIPHLSAVQMADCAQDNYEQIEAFYKKENTDDFSRTFDKMLW